MKSLILCYELINDQNDGQTLLFGTLMKCYLHHFPMLEKIKARYSIISARSGIYAETQLGTIKGRLVRAPGGRQEVEEYLGIPFAKPPVGDLRYSDPVPVDKFQDGMCENFDRHLRFYELSTHYARILIDPC